MTALLLIKCHQLDYQALLKTAVTHQHFAIAKSLLVTNVIPSIVQATKNKHQAMVEFFWLSYIDSQVANQYNLLHIAAQNGDISLVEFFLSKNLDIEAKDEDGNTPLHLAAEAGHEAVVKLLIDLGANHEPVNSAGKTPYQLANSSLAKKILLWASQPLSQITKQLAKLQATQDTCATDLQSASTQRLEQKVTNAQQSEEQLLDELLSDIRQAAMTSLSDKELNQQAAVLSALK